MEFLNRILRFFGLRRLSERDVQIDRGLLPRLQEIAYFEQRTLDEVAGHLLTSAVQDYVGEGDKVALWEALTNREKQVTSLVCLGLSNHEIAHRLVISLPTVKTHVSNILRKSGVKNREGLRLLFDWDFREWELGD
jgi:DNA-binding NarL/FixJ family response regulator